MAGFLGYPRVEYDLEQEVAKLVAQVGQVAARDCIGDFVGFLDGVRGDRGESLDTVPFAAVLRITQAGHD